LKSDRVDTSGEHPFPSLGDENTVLDRRTL
jgi:hypothetical protein